MGMRSSLSFACRLSSCALLAALGCSDSSHGMPSASASDAETEDALDAGAHADAEVPSADSGSGLDAAADAHAEAASGSGSDAGQSGTSDAAVGAAAFAQAMAATWEGTGTWSVEVVLPAAEAAPRKLKLTASGTAQQGSDYQWSGELEVPANQRSARATIMIVDDRERESVETLTLAIADSAARYTLSIADDDDDRWPTDDVVRTVDAADAFPGANLSGLAYQRDPNGGAPVLWMVRNGPSQLYRLVPSGEQWTNTATAEWSKGKTLVFPNGGGAPDSEGLSFAEPNSSLIYVVSERDGAGASAPTILAYDTGAAGGTLTATKAWNVTNDLRALMLEANTGPEAITWVPDSYLTAAGFYDESTNKAYDPAHYANHGAGLFLIGIEQTGGIYAYALDHTSGAATRVASIESGQKALMALEFDRDLNYLWAWCDDTCQNHATILRIEENPSSARKGRFQVRRHLTRPSSLDNVNNEGMTFAPVADCSSDKRAIFWVEDGSATHVLRRGTIPCGAFLGP